ncbi:tetratricopeptide repeat protein [Nostoc sp. TCL26-01]|uniref:tetratricopeptide repeat protein n=1 Tax=Nostoc sp. TCL26-01 TaxID=2576904 RepID=UPI0015B8E8AB|nr:tetratricopeptide repeat protein [Nostoc sp. TCL26-01]QLE58446.1 tetratricopeptide repeat protein [Nostoc sp. TCL26-01]
MEWQDSNLIQPLDWTGQVIFLAAEAGRSRHHILQQWLEAAQKAGAKNWLLDCDFEEEGVWAGVKDLFASILPEIQAQAPELIDKHSYELTIVLPTLRRQITVRNPNLTDTAEAEESVRNYPIDRAYRIVHGLIDLLAAWYQQTDRSPWVISCDRFHQAGALARMFFTELIRRRGQQLNLTLLIATDPGTEETVTSQFAVQVLGKGVRCDFPPEPETPVSPEEMTKLAMSLEERIRNDALEREIYLPKLIRYWLLSDQPQKALKLQAYAIGLYNHYGFYQEALVYSQPVLAHLDEICGEDSEVRWNLVGNLFGCYTATGNLAEAQQVLEVEALGKIHDPRQRVRIYYVMAMLYSRYLQNHDLHKAVEYLELGLATLPSLDLPAGDKHFYTSFTMNGLAYVRHRQGRPAEAIALCQQAFARLNQHLPPDKHRLHRSVLLYNIAKVYAVTGPYEDAIAHYTEAIAMDQNYSEYYNERGNVYLKLGRLDEAVRDYHQAIDLSPPYAEVWMNLGLCYRRQGKMAEAIAAYSVALDLNPHTQAALIGRAEAFEVLEQPEAALIDYNVALGLNADQPMLLANRAILHYQLGHLSAALTDLNQAILLSPENPDLYQNRAVAFMSLGRLDDALENLQTYLRLNPQASDRPEVESQISTLLASRSAA